MEYLKNHKKITQSEFIHTRAEIILRLKIEFDNGKTSKTAIREVSNQIYSDLIQKNILEKYSSYFQASYHALLYHQHNYNTKKVDSILKTLENKVYENYITASETFEKYNIGQDDFKNMTFEEFCQELLKYSVYKRCYYRLESTIEYLAETIELFYDLNNYEDFSISLLEDDETEITYERLNKIFQKYKKKLPKKKKETITKSDDSYNIHLLKYKNQIDKFSDDERCLLIHLAINEKYNLPDTEKIKLIVIGGNFNDYRIFEEIPNKNDLYNRIQKGHNIKLTNEKKIEIIDGNIDKLDFFKLTKTIDLLDTIRKKYK